jgi:hypothetical protein
MGTRGPLVQIPHPHARLIPTSILLLGLAQAEFPYVYFLAHARSLLVRLQVSAPGKLVWHTTAWGLTGACMLTVRPGVAHHGSENK